MPLLKWRPSYIGVVSTRLFLVFHADADFSPIVMSNYEWWGKRAPYDDNRLSKSEAGHLH